MESLNTHHQITVIHYEPSDFEMPPNSMGKMFRAIGATISAVAAHSQGQQLVENFALQDPTIQVKEGFISKAMSAFSNINISQISDPIEDDDIDGLKEKFMRGKILDFQTMR